MKDLNILRSIPLSMSEIKLYREPDKSDTPDMMTLNDFLAANSEPVNVADLFTAWDALAMIEDLLCTGHHVLDGEGQYALVELYRI